ncbi:DUF6082 family protein [Actinoplanes sp. NPDC051470]|uniref:DUF6082 family protein n=1 Tax=Actinoplanes sp. NPDC051470 TaxID=3157224 RepID=UPI003434B768
MHLDWKTLADIGQTYGGASALISAVALSGVAASIAYQVRAVRQQRHQAVRDQQRELLLLLASDPETYAHAFTRERAAMHPSELRRDVYAQMWLQSFSFAYETGHFTESDIRSPEGESLFSTEALRSHWAGHRDGWMSSPNSKARRFAEAGEPAEHGGEGRGRTQRLGAVGAMAADRGGALHPPQASACWAAAYVLRPTCSRCSGVLPSVGRLRSQGGPDRRPDRAGCGVVRWRR